MRLFATSYLQVVAARRKGLQLRPAGSTHSWSSLYPDEGDILLDMRSLKTLENGKRAELDHVRVY